jgi:phosphoribosylanthranilate isomerase
MCGLTTPDDGRAAAAAGADAVGLVFAKSERRVSIEEARAIVRELPPSILRFAVFVAADPAEIRRVVAEVEVDRVQVPAGGAAAASGPGGTRVVKVFRARDESVLREIRDSESDFFLLDTWSESRAGGTGRTFDWSIARRAREIGRLVLAGGLHPENVGDAILTVRPFGVDVSSGVESSPGRKDPARMRAFVEAVRSADRELVRREPAR